MSAGRFTRWILPGLLFQSVIVGGGYATGRELVEFFLGYGPRGGLYGILLATLAFSCIGAVFFEFARISSSQTYMDLFRGLLGRAWFLYELGYLALGILLLAVLGSAASEIAEQSFGTPGLVGTAVLCAAIMILVFFGTRLIERVLATWSFLLYIVFGLFIGIYLSRYGDGLVPALRTDPFNWQWLEGTVKYVGYSIVVLPTIMFVAQHFRSRTDAIIAGSLTGPLAMTPAVLFYLALASNHELVGDATVPSDFMIGQLAIGWLSLLFYVTIFGTFVETATAMIHAANERIAETRESQGGRYAHWQRSVFALLVLIVSMSLADYLGIVALIGRGYGTLTWFFIVIFLIPLMTVGVWKILHTKNGNSHGHDPY